MAGEMMLFPDTVEEFIEQYKVVDSDHALSNGAEFIPVFRMRQWFDHLQAQPNTILHFSHPANALLHNSSIGWPSPATPLYGNIDRDLYGR